MTEVVSENFTSEQSAALLEASESLGFFSSLWNHGSWTPTSPELLRASEARLLSGIALFSFIRALSGGVKTVAEY